MRYGICILPEHSWVQAEPLWRDAEERGFDHAWTYDHLTWAGLPDSPWHSTMVTLGLAGSVTQRIGLGTFVASPNFRHPVTFMRDVLTVDDVSRGRLLLGLGAGGDLDAEILGHRLTRGQRSRRFREFVPLLDRVLREDHVDHSGEFFGARDARNRPGCVQQPRVPFVVAANGPRAMALAARYGDGWMTTGPVGQVDPDEHDTARVEQWWRGIEEISRRYTEIETETQRDGTRADRPADRYLSLDASGVPALRSAGFFAEQVGRAHELGFTDVVVHRPRESDPYRAPLAVLDQIDLPAAPGPSGRNLES
ncbi:MAG TPA: LLM class flavin-dependent oxidoreductase [Ornithinimicrobium sp.]|uniref:LLM class flavin-dependent oxidoreductase n=1 Tax=Ornithinimicrobium sp. TaxID=1977084 RepID=UPI002B485DBC|nr:LLM class flavin-dependent oxidoreductase [Ornithinimicrobium sp.]HKJ11137.1 LLM class flavin-dependent oxidoreductase [Ornithinimicrobium sp.]